MVWYVTVLGWFQEDDCIIKLVEKYGARWSFIAKFLPGRIGKQCRERYLQLLRTPIYWFSKVTNLFWVKAAVLAVGTNVFVPTKDCSILKFTNPLTMKLPIKHYWSWLIVFRWYNHLSPAINKDAWTEDEERMLAFYHQQYGNKWAEISRFLPGRYVMRLIKI